MQWFPDTCNISVNGKQANPQTHHSCNISVNGEQAKPQTHHSCNISVNGEQAKPQTHHSHYSEEVKSHAEVGSHCALERYPAVVASFVLAAHLIGGKDKPTSPGNMSADKGYLV